MKAGAPFWADNGTPQLLTLHVLERGRLCGVSESWLVLMGLGWCVGLSTGLGSAGGSGLLCRLVLTQGKATKELG